MFGTNAAASSMRQRAPVREPIAADELHPDELIWRSRGLTWTYGRWRATNARAGPSSVRCRLLFVAGVVTCYWAEAQPNTALAASASIRRRAIEGKEVRFGVGTPHFFATVRPTLLRPPSTACTTASRRSAGSCRHEHPVGEVSSAASAGLYGMLVMVVLSVFIAGLWSAARRSTWERRSESARDEARHVYLLSSLLRASAHRWACVVPYGTSSLNNAGPHGLSEMLYAYSSGTGKTVRRSPASTRTRVLEPHACCSMFFGPLRHDRPRWRSRARWWARRPSRPARHLPTNGALFTALVVCVIVIVGALTFLPALSLGPMSSTSWRRRKDLTDHERPSTPRVPRSSRRDRRDGAATVLRQAEPEARREEPRHVRRRGRSVLTTIWWIRDLLVAADQRSARSGHGQRDVCSGSRGIRHFACARPRPWPARKCAKYHP